MPTVPASNLPYTGIPTVEPSFATGNNYQNIRATADSFGAFQGRQLSELSSTLERSSDTLAKDAILVQEQLNATKADDFTNKYQDLETKLLYGDPDKPGDTGFYGMKGEDAMRAMPQIRDQLLKGREQLRATLQNDRQRHLFDGETRNLQARTLANVGHHFVGESQTYATAVNKAGIDNGMTKAAQGIARGDDAEWQLGVGNAMKSAQKMLEANGQAGNPEIVNSTFQKIRGDAVKIKAEGLAEKNPLAATEFVKNNIDALHGDEANQLLAKYRARAASLQADIDNGFAAPPKQLGTTDKYDGKQSAGILAKYATGNAVVGGPSGIEGVHPEFARRIDTMAQSMPPDIRSKFNIISGFRDAERQAEVNPSVKNSYHTNHIAVDTTQDPDVINWINQHGREFGVGYTINHLPNEQNHLEPTEGGTRIAADRIPLWLNEHKASGKMAAAPDRVDNWEVRHNNFGGLRKVGVPAAGPNAGGFQSFDSPQEGVGAIVNQLHRYATGATTGTPLTTIRGIVSTWAPPNENDTETLIKNASKITGFDPDQQLDLNNPAVMGKMVEATIRNEHGGKLPVSPTVISNAAGQAPGIAAGNANAAMIKPGLVQLASSSPDTLIPSPNKQLPKLDWALPPLDQGEVPDAQVPGMAEQLEKIMQNVPADEVERRNAAVKRARQVLNQQYQEKQRAFRLHQEETNATSEAQTQKYHERMAKEVVPESEILTDRNLKASAQQSLIGFQRSLNKADPDPGLDKDNWGKLLQRVTAPWGTPGKITDQEEIIKAATDKQISRTSMENLLGHLKNTKDANANVVEAKARTFVSGGKSFVEGPPGTELMDKERGSRFFAFSQAMDDLMTSYKEQNKNPMDIFKLTNPKDQFSSPAGALMKSFEAPFTAQMTPPKEGGPRVWKDQNEVKSEIGKSITYDEALQILQSQFGMAPPSPKAPMAR